MEEKEYKDLRRFCFENEIKISEFIRNLIKQNVKFLDKEGK